MICFYKIAKSLEILRAQLQNSTRRNISFTYRYQNRTKFLSHGAFGHILEKGNSRMKHISLGVKRDKDLQEIFPFAEQTFPINFYYDYLEAYERKTMPEHWHSPMELVLCMSGCLTIYFNGAPYSVNAGECAFINSRTLHKMRGDSAGDIRIFGVYFSDSLWANSMESVLYKKYFKHIKNKSFGGLVVTPESVLGAQLIQLVYQGYALSHKQDEFGYELSCLSLISLIWKNLREYIKTECSVDISTSETSKRADNIPQRMLSFIHEHYAEKISILDISKALNYSKSGCFEAFKNFTGKTPNEYINEYRLSVAESMLMNTQMNITEISSLCGFSTPSYFTKLFKDKHGMPAAEYRKKYK